MQDDSIHPHIFRTADDNQLNHSFELLSEQTNRPKCLLIFVNPFGGKKKALKIYNRHVKSIFQMADIDANVVISQRSNQMRDFIMTQSLEHFDGIVCIGGDGTFSEIFNGLIFRSIKDLGESFWKIFCLSPALRLAFF